MQPGAIAATEVARAAPRWLPSFPPANGGVMVYGALYERTTRCADADDHALAGGLVVGRLAGQASRRWSTRPNRSPARSASPRPVPAARTPWAVAEAYARARHDPCPLSRRRAEHQDVAAGQVPMCMTDYSSGAGMIATRQGPCPLAVADAWHADEAIARYPDLRRA